MALYFTVEGNDNGNHYSRDYHWHVGEVIREYVWRGIAELQADGDELELILTNFKNLPVSTGRVQVWFGDTARTIYAWLTMKYGR